MTPKNVLSRRGSLLVWAGLDCGLESGEVWGAMPQDALDSLHTPEVSSGVSSLDMVKDVTWHSVDPGDSYAHFLMWQLCSCPAAIGQTVCAKVQMLPPRAVRSVPNKRKDKKLDAGRKKLMPLPPITGLHP